MLWHPALRSAPAVAPQAAEGWQPYSDEKLAELRAEGHPVFVDFTADWCLTCKVNERVALDTAGVMAAFAMHKVALLRGDWTNSDPAITKVLERFGRAGVPLYLLYPPSGEPQVLPQLLRPATVIEALESLPK